MKNNILDSSKYIVGSTLWFLDIEENRNVQLGDEYNHYIYEHPYFTMTKTPMKHLWKSTRPLPKMSHEPFDMMVILLTSDICVKSMVVNNIGFSENTGEFTYCDEDLEICLPEQILFRDRKHAVNERTRILKMIHDWSKSKLESSNEMFAVRKSVDKLN
jgi:hypothetical protein